MYLTPTDKHWNIDVEADDIEATVVWVVCVKNAKTKEKATLVGNEQIKLWFDERVRDGCFFVGHNIIKFDAPVLNRIVGTKLAVARLVDTYVLSMLFSPALNGGHSLEAWGKRVGIEKLPFSDYSHLSEEMITYCQRDVDLLDVVFHKLTERMCQIGFTERGAEIEHKAWHLIRKQQINGFYIDHPRTHQLFCELRGMEKEIGDEIKERFPPVLVCVGEYSKPFKKNGERSQNYERHLREYPKVELVEEGYKVFDYVEFSIGSPKQRVEKLLELGWEPREFTPRTDKGGGGNPKPTEKGDLTPSLQEFYEKSGIKEVKLIAEWIAVNARANMIGNWLNVYNDKTGCLHGNLWLAGTLRYRHDGPNTANIPRLRFKKADGKEVVLRGRNGLWTYESRDVWTTRDRVNRRLVGVDAKGIQLRVLAHYLEDEQFSKNACLDDAHTPNMHLLGLPNRTITKTITYATLMGAGDAKIATEAGIPLKEAKAAKKKFFDTLPGLKRLITRLKKELEQTGRITLCDGSRIMVPSPHMVIPYLLQGDESRIMKQAMIYVDEGVRKEKLDVLKCGDIHDEWQSDVSLRDVDRYKRVCERSFEQAGRSFDYRVPIECEAKVGLTWSETH